MRNKSADSQTTDVLIEAYRAEKEYSGKSFRARAAGIVQLCVGLYYLCVLLLMHLWSSVDPKGKGKRTAEIRFANHILFLEEAIHRLKYLDTARQLELLRDALRLTDVRTIGIFADGLYVTDRALVAEVSTKLRQLLPLVTPAIFQSLTNQERGCLHYQLRSRHLRENPALAATIIATFARMRHDPPAILIAGIARSKRLPADAVSVGEAAKAYLQELGKSRF
jgi:hypothetical protein